MKRIISGLAVVAFMAVMLVAMAVPAFAVADPQANCSGEAQSSAQRGDVGRAVRFFATQAPRIIGDIQSSAKEREACFGGTSAPGTGAPGKPEFAQGPK